MIKKQIRKIDKKTLFAFCLLLISLLPLLWSLLRPGFYASHDGEWMVIRLTAFHQALKTGQFPVRWLPRLNHGYGYPVTNFLYPLPFYLAEPFYVLTKNPATAVQVTMGLSVLAMAIGMFGLLGGFRKSGLFALVGTLVYVYSPYVAYNLYQRGSLGELVAMGIIPWVFWSIRTKRFPLASTFLAALITAHNVVAFLFLPLVVVYCSYIIIMRKAHHKPYRVFRYLLLFTVGFGLSTFFWYPALSELKYVRASTIAVSDFRHEFLSIDDAIKRTGIIPLIFSGGIPLLFLTHISDGFWNLFSPLQVIQFPWRLLSVFSFTSGAVVTWIAWKVSKKVIAKILFLTAVVLSIFISIPNLTPASFIDRPPSYYETNDDTTTVRAEYTPIWVQELPSVQPPMPLTHYYPGWRAFIDGRPAILANPKETHGLLTLQYPSTPGKVRFVWGETTSRTLANMGSVVSALSLLLWYQRSQKPNETSG